MTTYLPRQTQRKQLAPLPHPVYFVNLSREDWQDLMGRYSLPDNLGQYYERCADAIAIWSSQTYIHLKQRGLNVQLVPRCIPGKICIVPYYNLVIKHMPFNSYVVGVQYDCPRPEICEQRIVLNELAVKDSTDHFMPHWPHPTLQPRSQLRGTKVESMVFKGSILNLAYPFQDPAFSAQLQALGVNFVFNSEDESTQFQDWSDYTQADIVLAVRNATEYDLTLKPALKLINAWFAGCPAILGPEPGYQALRKSELDYFEVRSPEEAIAAVRRLKSEPALYAAMVENGYERAKEFTTDRLSERWRDLLAGPIAKGYERWLQQSSLKKVVGRPIQFAQRVQQHKQNYRHYLFHRDNGPRLFKTS